MQPFRAMQTAGFLKSLLDLAFWAVIVGAPVHVALVVWSYLGPGEGLYVYLVWRPPQRPELELWPVVLDLPLAGLFVGAALLVAAEAFRRGAQLEEDQAFTV